MNLSLLFLGCTGINGSDGSDDIVLEMNEYDLLDGRAFDQSRHSNLRVGYLSQGMNARAEAITSTRRWSSSSHLDSRRWYQGALGAPS